MDLKQGKHRVTNSVISWNEYEVGCLWDSQKRELYSQSIFVSETFNQLNDKLGFLSLIPPNCSSWYIVSISWANYSSLTTTLMNRNQTISLVFVCIQPSFTCQEVE